MNIAVYLFLILFMFSSCKVEQKQTELKKAKPSSEQLCRITSDSATVPTYLFHNAIYSLESWHEQFRPRMPPFVIEVTQLSEIKMEYFFPYPGSDTLKSVMPPALRSVYIMTNPQIVDECEDTAENARVASDSLTPKCTLRGDSVE